MRECFTLLFFSKMVEHDIKEHHKIMMFLLKVDEFCQRSCKKKKMIDTRPERNWKHLVYVQNYTVCPKGPDACLVGNF